MDYKREIAKAIKIEGVSEEEIYASIAVPPKRENGEYCLPCFKFSRSLRLSPVAIADKLKAEITLPACVESVESVSGYLNFKLNRSQFAYDSLCDILGRGETFSHKKSNGKTVVLDYSSVNIAKPFHIGHLLTTAIGGSLYRIYGYLGYKAVGINHLGDWGTQFGKLISAYKRWGNPEDVKKRGVQALTELYVRFHAEAENDPALDEEGRHYFKLIESGDKDATALFTWFKEITLSEVQTIYDRLGIAFDSYAGESFYNDKMTPVIDELKAKNLLTESDGALVVNLDDCDMPPCLILKKDGASLYATRDLAAAIYRQNTYAFDKCLYVVAYQQNLHFKQVFKVLEKMGKPWADKCVHVPFGMVSLEGGALSTRKGHVVLLKDVLDTAVEKANAVIAEKNPSLADKEKVAECVGTGAIVFSALSTARIKDMVFSYDKALSFEGETAPYLQYAHARCASILEKYGKSVKPTKEDGGYLCDDETVDVLSYLARFDAVVADAAEKYEPCVLARYLLDLAQAFNRFYIDHRVITEDERTTHARVLLTSAVKNVLKNGLSLLLIQAPEKM
ncbi:MAG: arginine--tRNA ligase [Clostridiales bacterium]|nr:arginine--tRNA ligase [Clostridiales bacterium]